MFLWFLNFDYKYKIKFQMTKWHFNFGSLYFIIQKVWFVKWGMTKWMIESIEILITTIVKMDRIFVVWNEQWACNQSKVNRSKEMVHMDGLLALNATGQLI